jgi:hypothetical protein
MMSLTGLHDVFGYVSRDIWQLISISLVSDLDELTKLSACFGKPVSAAF